MNFELLCPVKEHGNYFIKLNLEFCGFHLALHALRNAIIRAKALVRLPNNFFCLYKREKVKSFIKNKEA